MSSLVLDKLGIKNGSNVCIVGGKDYLLPKLLERIGKEGKLLRYEMWRDFVEDFSGLEEVDVVLFWAKKKSILELFFRETRPLLRSNGAIWIVLTKKKFRKDVMKDFPDESDVFRAGRKAGYVDVKVASLSDSEYALKFVIPVKER